MKNLLVLAVGLMLSACGAPDSEPCLDNSKECSGLGRLELHRAVYGSNCRDPVDMLHFVKAACDDLAWQDSSCVYRAGWGCEEAGCKFDDHCARDMTFYYTCDGKPQTKVVPPEAYGRQVTLQCCEER